MKVLCLLGSPRSKGNSATLAGEFCRAAAEKGAEVKTFELNKMNYRGCQGCYACKTRLEHCALKDDLTTVFDELKAADVLVLATPVYFADITTQLKGFIDRFFSVYGPDFMSKAGDYRLAKGKSLVFCQSQGAAESDHGDLFGKYKIYFRAAGFGQAKLLRVCGVDDAAAVAGMPELLAQARQTAADLLG